MRSKTEIRGSSRPLAADAAGVIAAIILLLPAPALAQNDVSIRGGTTVGVTNVNAASGNNNQQLNAGVIGQADAAFSLGTARQHNGSSSGSSGDAAAAFAPRSFAGSSGWTAVNGVSGNDNQQANLAAFAIGIEAGAAADALLSQTRASHEPAGRPQGAAGDPDRSVAIGDGAFENSSGLVQVSLIGGDRNSSANTFALSISGDAKPNGQ